MLKAYRARIRGTAPSATGRNFAWNQTRDYKGQVERSRPHFMGKLNFTTTAWNWKRVAGRVPDNVSLEGLFRYGLTTRREPIEISG